MVNPAQRADVPIRLECVSWHLVQHHLMHGALRFEPAALAHLRLLQASDDQSHFCLATLADEPIAVLGLLHYRVTYDDLHFAYIRVRQAYRHRGIGRRMLSEVVAHPTCIHLSRLHWSAGSKGCEAVIRHLEWLRDNGRRICGTPFRLIVDPAFSPAAPPAIPD